MILRIDMGNSLLYGITGYELNRLQKLQNSCARLIYGLRRSANVSNMLHELHWLPIRARIVFKVTCFVYKCIHGMAPVYLSSLLEYKNHSNLTLARARCLTTYGDRAFSSCGPALWNALPLSVRQCQSLDLFKRQLKTHLFSNYNNYIQVLHQYRC